ncbi:hypothetical protein FI667_g6187, partial [Globisporangium splendens]
MPITFGLAHPQEELSMDDSTAMNTTATAAADAIDIAAIDVSDDELAVCISVLRKFHSSEGLTHLQTPKFRQFRLAVMPLVSDLRSKLHSSKPPRATRKERRERKLAERTANRARDKQLINSTTLRAGRRSKLMTQTAEAPLLPQVPDGAVSSSSPLQVGNSKKGDTPSHGEAAQAKAEAAPTLHYPRQCYVCKQKYKQLHHFYDRLCPPCAKLNFEKRLQTADLRDHVAIVTGARVKIGYEITLKLLRSGATVIATTRFPKDAAYRFARERDFDAWRDRLQIYGMDFRDLGVIDKFMDHVATTFGSVDILINNATQTIRRPVHYYKHLIKSEVAPIPEEFNGVEQILCGNANFISAAGATKKTLCAPDARASSGGVIVRADVPPPADIPSSVLLSQVAVVSEDLVSDDIARFFPEGQLDINNQQVDLRTSNSWIEKIDHVETMELVEVFAINAMAPFILNKRAIPLLEKLMHYLFNFHILCEQSTNKHKFIINVSAMEGKFNREKTPYHPHTNMAKAAANMMTRTVAADLATRGIFMNSVDTGWINDENPRDIAAQIASTNFQVHQSRACTKLDIGFHPRVFCAVVLAKQTPLDEIDATARVLDPIFALHQPHNGHQAPVFGQFLKDFGPSECSTAAAMDTSATEAMDVSEDELDVCVSVLRRFDTSRGLMHLQTPRFRQLRLAVLSLADDFRGSCPLLRPRSKDGLTQEHKRVERAHNRARDKQLINSTTLRAGRRSKLMTQTAEAPLLPQVPDGAVSSSSPLQVGNSKKGDTPSHGEAAQAKAEAAPTLHYPRQCYVCKQKYKQLHHFYDRLCPPCAKLNFEKRLQTADLRDHVAIVTGARVKIGYEITLKLLRSGATVIATTRFPKDAAYRFARERDFDAWRDRLQIYGMDFRDLGVIDKFMDHVATTFGSVDILINNATQTIRRPVHYYKHLIKSEVAPIPEEFNGVEQILCGNANFISAAGATKKTLCAPDARASSGGVIVRADVPPPADIPSSVLLSQVAVVSEDLVSDDIARFFPEGQLDINNQQVDLRTSNSWIEKIDHVETMELVEVFAINAMAPFILNKRAIPLLEKLMHYLFNFHILCEQSTNKHKFIINVSAMEGKFNREKTPYHPHTNMAKAAANMMTRTVAADLATCGIFMNSVDTGWINDENPRHIAAEKATTTDFQTFMLVVVAVKKTPLDEIDAAARVLDPIFVLHQPQSGNKPPVFGQFLKDFGISKW